MIGNQDVRTLMSSGGNVVTDSGDKIGSIGEIYLDDRTGQPEWVTVNTGMFGTSQSFVPLRDATAQGADIRVPFTKDKVKDAPRIEDSDRHLEESEEADLYRYYELDYSQQQAGFSETAGTEQVGHDTSGPTTDDAMTRSEERLNIDKQSQATGRVRLRKWVETEDVNVTVPVTKEKAVIEREPVTDSNVDQALDGPAISEEEHEVVLNEERVVVDKTVEPVERVRVGKEAVTEQETVSDAVRKEQIEVEGDAQNR
jgi:uncharacterized protein (TIGR02271 family)